MSTFSFKYILLCLYYHYYIYKQLRYCFHKNCTSSKLSQYITNNLNNNTYLQLLIRTINNRKFKIPHLFDENCVFQSKIVRKIVSCRSIVPVVKFPQADFLRFLNGINIRRKHFKVTCDAPCSSSFLVITFSRTIKLYMHLYSCILYTYIHILSTFTFYLLNYIIIVMYLRL